MNLDFYLGYFNDNLNVFSYIYIYIYIYIHTHTHYKSQHFNYHLLRLGSRMAARPKTNGSCMSPDPSLLSLG